MDVHHEAGESVTVDVASAGERVAGAFQPLVQIAFRDEPQVAVVGLLAGNACLKPQCDFAVQRGQHAVAIALDPAAEEAVNPAELARARRPRG